MSNDQFEFEISRTFEAPRNIVWRRAWTEEEQIKKWFGPKGLPIFHNTLDFNEPESMNFIAMFSDEKANILRHPWNENWPMQMYSIVTFEEENGKTTVTVNLKAYEASDIESKEFEDGAESMNQGWSGTFEQLEEYLRVE